MVMNGGFLLNTAGYYVCERAMIEVLSFPPPFPLPSPSTPSPSLSPSSPLLPSLPPSLYPPSPFPLPSLPLPSPLPPPPSPLPPPSLSTFPSPTLVIMRFIYPSQRSTPTPRTKKDSGFSPTLGGMMCMLVGTRPGRSPSAVWWTVPSSRAGGGRRSLCIAPTQHTWRWDRCLRGMQPLHFKRSIM